MSENPYQPGSDFDVDRTPVASREKPVSVKILGILNLAFAVMGVCGVGFGGIALFANAIPQDPNFPNPTIELIQNNGGYRIYMIVSLALGMIATVVLGFAGVGLIQYRRYGRSLALAYAWYAIVSVCIAMVVNTFFLVIPAWEQVQQQQAQGAAMSPQLIASLFGAIGGTYGGCFGMIYPAVLLFFMYRRKTIDSLSA